VELEQFVDDFTACFMLADRRRPQAVNARSKVNFQPGIGPHAEAQAVKLVVDELESFRPETYRGRLATGVAYPETPRQKCDLCIGSQGEWEWSMEVKMLRSLGDNGKLNDNIVMHILSPYPAHRSALTDCVKLVSSSLGRRRAVLIYGFEHEEWPLSPAIEAFEALARSKVRLLHTCLAPFFDLVHPYHSRGRVVAWEIERP
jgi:hypothetical protein